MVTNVCKVMQRLSDGDSVVCTVKAVDRPLNEDDYKGLMLKMRGDFSADPYDTLYFTIRTTIDGKKDNYKLSNYKEVETKLRGIFNVA